MKPDCDALVIGAGITGLTVAFRLHFCGIRVALLEAAQHPGGVIATERTDGFLYERGPNSILETDALVARLLHDAGIAGERIDANPAASRRYVVRGGALVAFPTSPAAFLATPLFSARAKLRLLGEPFVRAAPAASDESVADFVTRRLGREVLDYAVEPFVAGVYAGVPETLSLAAAFPRLHALEQRYGSLVGAALRGALDRKGHRPRGPRVFSFSRGMQTLTDALARAIPAARYGLAAVAIRKPETGGYSVDVSDGRSASTLSARSVVLAVPAYAAAPLVEPLCAGAAAALAAIPYAPIASVARAYARGDIAHALDGFGFLAPRLERRGVLGALFSSSLFEHRAPRGAALLTVYAGGARDPGIAGRDEAGIDSVVAAELAALVGAAGSPIHAAVTRRSRAIAQYTLGHLERMRGIDRLEAAYRALFLCGSYRGGVSVADCIGNAHRVAERVRVTLREESR